MGLGVLPGAPLGNCCIFCLPFCPWAGQNSGASTGAAGLGSAMCAGPLLLFPTNLWGEPGGGGAVAHDAGR